MKPYALTTALILCLGGCLAPSSTQDLKLWHAEGEAESYTGDDLFIYINGGAEIYHEYGFQEVIVQRYTGPSGAAITVEQYRMRDSDAAYGIYSFKRGKKGKPVPYGDEGLLANYYLNFWKGDRVVTLIGQDDDPETVQGLHQLAKTAAAGITGTSEVPDLVRSLPREGLLHSQYLAGPLAFFNCCPALSRKLFPFQTAALGNYENGNQILLFDFPPSLECEQVLTDARQAFGKEGEYSNLKDRQEGGFTVRHREHGLILVTAEGNRLEVTLKAPVQ